MEWENAADIALAMFIGTALAHLLIFVLSGRTDELRYGVRSLVNDTDDGPVR